MTPESRPWRALRTAARRAAAWPFRVAEARATLRALATMDRRELADLGLVASDLRDVSALPLDGDPSELLARRARERRRNAFAAPAPLLGGNGPVEDPDDWSGRRRPSPRPQSWGRRAHQVKTG